MFHIKFEYLRHRISTLVYGHFFLTNTTNKFSPINIIKIGFVTKRKIFFKELEKKKKNYHEILYIINHR